MIKVGDVVDGKYRITRILGEGGMGTVVEAYRDTLDMLVAIKFMRSEMLAANGGAERFMREARALVKLKSQHAVKVHDLGVHGRMPYIVMEHLEGMDMQTTLDKHGPMRAADAARHVRQACEAIAEAHSLGIYHRDLKPANLFLSRGASDRIIVKVLDFGIAKMIRPDDKKSLQNSLTESNTLMGTLPYMSPEQLMTPKEVDARTDIWSLGVVLHELVTGDLPFQGRDLCEIQQAIRFEACILPAMPASLEPVIRRCLEKNREDRYASVVDLAMALRPLINESFSPFEMPPARHEFRTPQGVVIRSATASPIPAVRSDMPLAIAEGLAVPKESEPATERAQGAAPQSDDAVTLRVPGNVAARGTVIIPPETPKSPTIKQSPSDRRAALAATTLQSPLSPAAPKEPRAAVPLERALANLQPQVVNVRRGLLVVKQPIQLARRRRVSSSRSWLVVGALTVVALVFGVATYREKTVAVALSLSSTPHFDAIISATPGSTSPTPGNDNDLADAFTDSPETPTTPRPSTPMTGK